MSDRRAWPATERIAHVSLAGQVGDLPLTEGEVLRVTTPVADLCAASGGRERQLLRGEGFCLIERQGARGFGFALRDGYCGFVDLAQLAALPAPTHRVRARASHLYPAASVKAQAGDSLSLGALVTVTGFEARFAKTSEGMFLPMMHLAALDEPESDLVEVAERLLGTPYLWGGNSAFGIDCSGLVQAAALACGCACPGDSDQQQAALGAVVAPDTPVVRGDLFFWKGHVALAQSPTHLIHANAFQMAVGIERIDHAIDRIAARGDGPVLLRRRISLAGTSEATARLSG